MKANNNIYKTENHNSKNIKSPFVNWSKCIALNTPQKAEKRSRMNITVANGPGFYFHESF